MTPGAQKKQRLLLGLHVSRLSLQPGQTRSQRELAYFCGCSKSTIQWIEKQAMQKVRLGLEPFLILAFQRTR